MCTFATAKRRDPVIDACVEEGIPLVLVNRTVRTSAGGVDGQDCLLQTRMRCTPDRGHLHPYPTPDLLTSDPEEEELNLLYRDVPTYALGHGAAAHWGGEGGAGPTWAETAFIPRAVVPGVLFDLDHPMAH